MSEKRGWSKADLVPVPDTAAQYCGADVAGRPGWFRPMLAPDGQQMMMQCPAPDISALAKELKEVRQRRDDLNRRIGAISDAINHLRSAAKAEREATRPGALKRKAWSARREIVGKLRAEGKTFAEIGEALGVHKSRAYELFLRWERDQKPAATSGQRDPADAS